MAKRDEKEKKGEEDKDEKLEAKADKELPEIDPPPPKGEPWPDATPEPMRPVVSPFDEQPTQPEQPMRTRTETATMPVSAMFGSPPAINLRGYL